MLEFLPQRIKNAISHCNNKRLYELRLRENMPISINYDGKYVFLSDFGAVDDRNKAMVCNLNEIEDCVYKAGNYSIYSVEEQMKQGYITAKDGVRIGLAGEYVMEKGQIHAIRGITSLCIRIPHEIYGCGEEIYRSCMSDRIHNLLICSPPGLGKTTILRDISRIMCMRAKVNVLICDERGELYVGEMGKTCDIIKYTDKATAFEIGIRALRPDVIITDELSARDGEALRKAVCAGVKIIASAHLWDKTSLMEPFLGVFERYVFLKDEMGKIAGIYDAQGRDIKEC